MLLLSRYSYLLATHESFCCHALSPLTTTNKKNSLPQATVISRNRMQNTFAILEPLFTHSSCCFSSLLDQIFTRKLTICSVRNSVSPSSTLSDTLAVWVLLSVLSHVFAASLKNSYRTIAFEWVKLAFVLSLNRLAGKPFRFQYICTQPFFTGCASRRK